MQLLNIKNKGQVKVIRSWQDASGKHIFLHHNGSYADAKGNPLTCEADFNIIPPIQRKAALDWWKRIGRAQAEEYYAQLASAEAAKLGDFQEGLAANEANSILDAVLYSRKSAKGPGAVSKPQSWMECGFRERPDWWGQAESIKFADYVYIMQKTVNENPTGNSDQK